jgi:hypothetical protein
MFSNGICINFYQRTNHIYCRSMTVVIIASNFFIHAPISIGNSMVNRRVRPFLFLINVKNMPQLFKSYSFLIEVFKTVNPQSLHSIVSVKFCRCCFKRKKIHFIVLYEVLLCRMIIKYAGNDRSRLQKHGLQSLK